jgi:hypothetical protein
MSHHEMYVRTVMADRMREALAARRTHGEVRRSPREKRPGHGVVALIARMVLR